MPLFKAFGMINLQYEIRIFQKIHNKGAMSQWQLQVTIFLSETDVTLGSMKSFDTCKCWQNTHQKFLPKFTIRQPENRIQNVSYWTRILGKWSIHNLLLQSFRIYVLLCHQTNGFGSFAISKVFGCISGLVQIKGH